MAATVSGARAFTVRALTLREGRMADGQIILLSAQASIAARRPDRLYAAVGSDIGSFVLWYDGRNASILVPTENTFGRTPLTGDLENLARILEDRLGVDMPVRPPLSADPFAAALAAGPTSGRYLGRSFIGSTEVDHFALRNASFDWEIWLEATPRALPRRVSIVDRDGTGARIVTEFDGWNLWPRLPDSLFAFSPPRGAVRADIIPVQQ
jgi:hypothetical protein